MGDILNAKLLETLNTWKICGCERKYIKLLNAICKLKTFEKKYQNLEKQVTLCDRKIRKNNIVIFGLSLSRENLLHETLIKLNNVLDLSLNENDLNDIYFKGEATVGCWIYIFLEEIVTIKNTRKLKGTNIFINHYLTPDDRAVCKTLYGYSKKARSEGHNATEELPNSVLVYSSRGTSSTPTTPSVSLENIFLDCHQEWKNSASVSNIPVNSIIL